MPDFSALAKNILGYITEDGQKTAMWSPLPHHNGWLSINDKKESEQIRNAIEILDQRQAPRLITLTVPLISSDVDKENPNVSP